MNGLTEKLAELESGGLPVMVIDADNCSAIPDSLGMKAGEIAVYRSGREVGRVISSADVMGDMVKVKEIASR
jgi:hypothetical protein